MDKLDEFYAAVGSDKTVIVSRLGGNETLVKLLLTKFPKDDSFSKLSDALGKGETEDAFRAAHTLKGVAANLGIQSLFEKSSSVAEYLRSGNLVEARVAMPSLSLEYERVCTLIRAMA